jgi:2-polyprenyl-3-methyl-5-hydroxy-6-metoxy-1,4-benzoquinol methylase
LKIERKRTVAFLHIIKKAASPTIGRLFRLMPVRIRRRIATECVVAEAREPARDALCALLKLDSQIYRITGRKSMEYNGGTHIKHRVTGYHDFFVSRIRSGECVLDIGCGRGELDYEIARKAGGIVVGIDYEKDRLDSARENYQHPNLEFIHGDVSESIPSQQFDTIIMSNVLEHIENRVAFLQKVKDRIHPGRFLFRVPMFNRDWRVPLRKELGLPYFSENSHHTEYTQESFIQEMDAAGLRVSHMEIRWGEIWAEVLPNA